MRIAAIAYWQETPLRDGIEAGAAARLGKAADLAAQASARRVGRADADGKIKAQVMCVSKSPTSIRPCVRAMWRHRSPIAAVHLLLRAA